MSGLTFRRAVADGLSQMLESVCGLKLTGTKQVERLFASEIHRRYEIGACSGTGREERTCNWD